MGVSVPLQAWDALRILVDFETIVGRRPPSGSRKYMRPAPSPTPVSTEICLFMVFSQLRFFPFRTLKQMAFLLGRRSMASRRYRGSAGPESDGRHPSC